jgi:hypothetical protein
MICPQCQTPIADATVVKAAASINGKRNAGKGSRPGARGLVRNIYGKNGRISKAHNQNGGARLPCTWDGPHENHIQGCAPRRPTPVGKVGAGIAPHCQKSELMVLHR